MRSKTRLGSVRFLSRKNARSLSNSAIACANAISSALSTPSSEGDTRPNPRRLVVRDALLVGGPEREIADSLREMAEQLFNLLLRRRLATAASSPAARLRPVRTDACVRLRKIMSVQGLQGRRPLGIVQRFDAFQFLYELGWELKCRASGRTSERVRCGRRRAHKAAPRRESRCGHTRAIRHDCRSWLRVIVFIETSHAPLSVALRRRSWSSRTVV